MLFPIIISLLLSIFSTVVMSYISMATPIGPWIAPTIVLFSMLIFKVTRHTTHSSTIAHITAASSIGGILATGFGFSFPAIYFLDPVLFASWMEKPLFFAMYMTGLAIAAGSFGFLLANLFEKNLIVEQQLSFPIGALTQKMIVAGNQIRKAYELMVGFFGTTIFCLLQDGCLSMRALAPKSILLFQGAHYGVLQVPIISFDFWPMLWAIGFITGHLIAVPLGVGALLKTVMLDPLHTLFFAYLSAVEFSFMFCTGMALFSIVPMINGLSKFIKKCAHALQAQKIKSTTHKGSFFARMKELFFARTQSNFFSRSQFAESLILLVMCSIILSLFDFSYVQQLFLLLLSGLFTYQMAVIAGKWGIAPLGRFATFVMIPAMFLLKISLVQIILIATFVEICGGVAVDILFNRKMNHMMHLDGRSMRRYQYFGLMVSALAVGFIFWILIRSCGLGSAQLFAYKALSRQLLINAFMHGQNFNYYVMCLGLALSFILQKIKINPMLVLGGLLMPFNLSIGLIFGGLLSLLVKDKAEWEPFWSGVYTANSLWMIIKAIL